MYIATYLEFYICNTTIACIICYSLARLMEKCKYVHLGKHCAYLIILCTLKRDDVHSCATYCFVCFKENV